MFEVKGSRPQWRMVYERLETMRIGDTIDDDELAALVPNAASKASITVAFWRAVKEMENEHKRSFARIRKVGYRMVEAYEHEMLARQQHTKAKRRLTTAVRKAHSADRTLLTLDERQRIDAIEDTLGRQKQWIQRLETRQAKTEERVAPTEKDSATLSDRLDKRTDLLGRQGIVWE